MLELPIGAQAMANLHGVLNKSRPKVIVNYVLMCDM